MKPSSKMMFLGLGLFLVAAMIVPPSSQSSGGAPVNVLNTPLPVQGTVSVGNKPSVDVANTPTVNLAGGSSVNVSNPLDSQSNPAPLVTLEAAQPYEDTCDLNLPPATVGTQTCNFQAIPTGKRLVIQEVDANILVDPGVKPVILQVGTGSPVPHYLTTTFTGSYAGLQDVFAAHQATHLYVSKNQKPSCTVLLGALTTNPSDGMNCSLSGFLVDAP